MVTLTTALLWRRFVGDYARTGVNLVFLAIIPVVVVVVAAPAMADAAEVLGGAGGGPAVETVTAGWAAGSLTAIAMYFQVSAAQKTDRRLVQAGLRRAQLVTARLLTGALLAALATATAVLTLAVRTQLQDPWRVAAGTAMFAVVYLALGAIVGATVRSPVNGTAVLLFVWILDVFFGPTLSGSDSPLLRALPTHFISLWMVDLPSGHGGPAALVWTLAWLAWAVVSAVWVLAAATRHSGRRNHAERIGLAAQVRAGLRMSWRDWRHTPVLLVLLAAVPAVFVLLSDAVTPHGQTPVVLREEGQAYTALLDPAHIHAGTMAPIAVASLAALVGVFVVLDAQAADRRLVLAGQRPAAVLGTRLTMVLAAAALATGVSLAVTALVFQAHQWSWYIAGNALLAVTYGLIGMLIGPVFGRVAGVFMAFLLPFLDLGIGQSPVLRGEPTGWSRWLPGYGGIRVMIDGALTSGFDEPVSMAIGLAWVLALGVAVAMLLRGVTGTAARRRRQKASDGRVLVAGVLGGGRLQETLTEASPFPPGQAGTLKA